MFSELMKVLTEKQTIVDEMNTEFLKMILLSKEMFVTTTDYLCLGGNKETIKKEIFPKDKQINKLEQTIRRQVVTHFTVSGVGDLASMLIFMAIARDAERIGDNTKNIYELAKYCEDLQNCSSGKVIINLRNKIVENMTKLIRLYEKSKDSKKRTNEYLSEVGELMKICDKQIAALLKNRAKEKDAAVYVLLVRYFKRILAHMSNIGTSLIMPVDKLDYFKKAHKTKIK